VQNNFWVTDWKLYDSKEICFNDSTFGQVFYTYIVLEVYHKVILHLRRNVSNIKLERKQTMTEMLDIQWRSGRIGDRNPFWSQT
jgi:hypothetical protein